MDEKLDHQLRKHLSEKIPSSADSAIKSAIAQAQQESNTSNIKKITQTLIPLALFFIAVFSITQVSIKETELESWQKEVLLLQNLDLYSAMEEE